MSVATKRSWLATSAIACLLAILWAMFLWQSEVTPFQFDRQGSSEKSSVPELSFDKYGHVEDGVERRLAEANQEPGFDDDIFGEIRETPPPATPVQSLHSDSQGHGTQHLEVRLRYPDGSPVTGCRLGLSLGGAESVDFDAFSVGGWIQSGSGFSSRMPIIRGFSFLETSAGIYRSLRPIQLQENHCILVRPVHGDVAFVRVVDADFTDVTFIGYRRLRVSITNPSSFPIDFFLIGEGFQRLISPSESSVTVDLVPAAEIRVRVRVATSSASRSPWDCEFRVGPDDNDLVIEIPEGDARTFPVNFGIAGVDRDDSLRHARGSYYLGENRLPMEIGLSPNGYVATIRSENPFIGGGIIVFRGSSGDVSCENRRFFPHGWSIVCEYPSPIGPLTVQANGRVSIENLAQLDQWIIHDFRSLFDDRWAISDHIEPVLSFQSGIASSHDFVLPPSRYVISSGSSSVAVMEFEVVAGAHLSYAIPGTTDRSGRD